jgi:hypothetical protein
MICCLKTAQSYCKQIRCEFWICGNCWPLSSKIRSTRCLGAAHWSIVSVRNLEDKCFDLMFMTLTSAMQTFKMVPFSNLCLTSANNFNIAVSSYYVSVYSLASVWRRPSVGAYQNVCILSTSLIYWKYTGLILLHRHTFIIKLQI